MATGIGAGAVGLNAALGDDSKEPATAPEWPWPYKILDVELVRKRGHMYYYKGGSLNGACALITLIAGRDYGKIINELMAWYGTTPFPSDPANQYASKHEYLVEEYKSDQVLPTTVSGSPLCHVSVNTWCRETGFASGSKQRAERCARLTGDVAAKAAELLNSHALGNFVRSDFETIECTDCHFMGENYESGQFIIGKGSNCDDCHGEDPHLEIETL